MNQIHFVRPWFWFGRSNPYSELVRHTFRANLSVSPFGHIGTAADRTFDKISLEIYGSHYDCSHWSHSEITHILIDYIWHAHWTLRNWPISLLHTYTHTHTRSIAMAINRQDRDAPAERKVLSFQWRRPRAKAPNYRNLIGRNWYLSDSLRIRSIPRRINTQNTNNFSINVNYKRRPRLSPLA